MDRFIGVGKIESLITVLFYPLGSTPVSGIIAQIRYTPVRYPVHFRL